MKARLLAECLEKGYISREVPFFFFQSAAAIYRCYTHREILCLFIDMTLFTYRYKFSVPTCVFDISVYH